MEQLERTIRKKIIRKHKMAFLQEALYHYTMEDESKALVFLELASLYSGVIEKNNYTSTLLSNKTKWTKKHYMDGILPGSMFRTHLRKNFIDSMGIDFNTYELNEEEKNFVKCLDISA